jgi:hypothetical protein
MLLFMDSPTKRPLPFKKPPTSTVRPEVAKEGARGTLCRFVPRQTRPPMRPALPRPISANRLRVLEQAVYEIRHDVATLKRLRAK